MHIHTKHAVIKRICAVLKLELCKAKVYGKVAQGCKKEKSSKNGSFGYEMLAEKQTVMEL